jgi:outer membrane protein OmpA-like peptidoglycan-associated protein
VSDKGTVVVPVIIERIERLSKEGPLAELVEDRILLREQVFFREAVAELIPASTPVLHAVRKVLQDNPQVVHLLVAGHTNSNGTKAHNRALSQARSEAVCAWLEINGIAGVRLIPKGYGEEHPLVDDSHEDAMVINRRVEFMVLRSDAEGEPPEIPDVDQLPTEVQQDRMRVPADPNEE